MTGIIKTDQLQGAQGSSVTVPTGHTLAVTSNATVGGTLGVTGIGTFADDIVIGDGKTIGSASKTDAITIASSGLTQLRSTGIGAGSQVFQVIDDGATLFQLRAEDGNISFPQAGAGIYLGVTAGNSANLLNDYEEGSWTPSVAGNTTYDNQVGRYVKVGNKVTLWFYIQINQRNSPGVPYIAGTSPFTNSSSITGSGLVHYFEGIQNNAVVLTARIDPGGSNINISGSTGSAGTTANVNHDWVKNGGDIYGFVTHYTG